MSPHAPHSMLMIGRTAAGYLVRVAGRGTMHESHAVQGFAQHLIDEGPDTTTFIVDLDGCDYLDSTFLGCLAMLHRRFNGAAHDRFRVSASQEKRLKLLGPTRLDRILPLSEEPSALVSDSLEALVEGTTPDSLGRHVMEAHRRLAELGGAQQAAFQAIADRLAEELGEATVDAAAGMN